MYTSMAPEISEQLEELLCLFEAGRISAFPVFLNRARKLIYNTWLPRFIIGDVTAEKLLIAWASKTDQRPTVLAQICLGSMAKPHESIVRAIGQGFGFNSKQIDRLVAICQKQSVGWKPSAQEVLDMAWLPNRVDYKKPEFSEPGQVPKPKRNVGRRKRQPKEYQGSISGIELGHTGALESQLERGDIAPATYYQLRRNWLGISREDVASHTAIPLAKLTQLEDNPAYHLDYKNLKILATFLGISPALLREAHERTRMAIMAIPA